MKSKHIGLQRTFLVQLLVHLLHKLKRLAEVINSPYLHAPHPHLIKGSRNGLWRQVHIKYRRNSACKIFQNCKLCQFTDIFCCELRLHRKDLFI